MSSAATTGEVRQKGAVSALVLLLGLNLLNYADRSVLFAVQPLMQKDLLAPNDPDAKTKMGLLVTAFLVVYMVAAPLFGILADRWRRWWIVAIGVLGAGLASMGTGLAPAFGLVLVMRAMVGLSEAAYGPAAPTLISDLFPVSRRGGALAWFYMAIPVGTALGYVYGGAMAAQWGWRSAFLWLAAPAVALGAVCFLMKEPARGSADGGQGRKARWADYKLMLKTPSFLYTCAGMTLLTFALGGMQAWAPELFASRLAPHYPGLSERDLLQKASMWVGAIILVMGVVATLVGGYLADRLRRRWGGAYLGMSGASMLIAFPLFVGALYVPFPWAWWLLGLACFFLFLNTGPSNTALANVTHPAVRSSAFALNILIVHALGDAISPALMGRIADSVKASSGVADPARANAEALTYAFLLAGLAIVASGVVWLIGSRHLARDTDLAPTRLAA
ncbi:MAG TPA: MFS transporter [Phycisphaerales bacterium]|nr:MFS transporter [Phycisphaerales bacterium]